MEFASKMSQVLSQGRKEQQEGTVGMEKWQMR